MKKFKFNLQTVHNVRELREETEKQLLLKFQSDVNDAALRVAQIEIMRTEAIENYAERLKSGEQLSVMEMEMNLNHFSSLNYLQREAEKVLKEKKEVCQQQIEKVAEAMREVKVTNRLQEKQKALHQLEFARNEQNNLDELVSTKFARHAR